MSIWSDGKTLLQYYSNDLRLFDENLEMVRNMETRQQGLEPFFVHPETGRLYKGTGSYYPPYKVEIVDLEAMEVEGNLDVKAYALGVLDDGRLVGVIDGENGPLFVVGDPEEGWELSIPMDRETLFDEYTRRNLYTYSDQWSNEEFGGGSTLRVTKYGVVVSDGPTGIMALWRPGNERFEDIWHGCGVYENELFGLALEEGVVYVSRVAGRASKVLHLVDGGTGSAVGDGEYFGADIDLVGDDLYVLDEQTKSVTVFDSKSFDVIAKISDLNGYSFQGGGGVERFFVGHKKGLHILRLDGDTLHHKEVSPYDLVTVRFPTPEDDTRKAIMKESEAFRMGSGISGRTKGGVSYSYLGEVHRKSVEALTSLLVDKHGIDEEQIEVVDE